MTPSVILKAATRIVVGLMLVFSVFILVRGHNEPGGGFAGALVAATAFSLLAIAEGVGAARAALRVQPRVLIALGLLAAVASGLAGPLAGRPFMTGLWWELKLRQGASLTVGTPALFDAGVFLTVTGVVMTLVLALEEEV